MTMPNKPSVTDFYNMTETQKLNILWTGITELWNKSAEIETTVKEHEKLLITGDGENELPVMERLRNVESYVASWKYWGRFVGGILIAQTLAFIGGVVVAVVRFLPILERLANKP